MAKVTQQNALLSYLNGEEEEPIASAYRPGVATGPLAGRVQTAGKPGQVSQLPGSGAAVTDLVGSTGAGVAQSMAGLGTGAALGGISLATDYLGGKLKPKEEMPTYGGEHGAITDSYGRRFEGTGPGTAGGFTRGAGYGAVAGPVGSVLGGLIGMGAAAATRNAPSAFSDFSKEDAADALTKGYQTYLGREPGPGDVDARLAGQGLKPGDRYVGEKNLFAQLSDLKNSDEAQRFAAGGGETEAATGGGVSGALSDLLGGNTGAAGGVDRGPVTNGATSAGGLGQFADALGGFDTSKFDGVDESPKYIVGRVLSKYPPTPDGLKQALPEIQALSEQYGLGDVQITGSKGDKLSFGGATNPKFQGITEFDVIKAAGEGGKGWQWLDPNATADGAVSSSASPASSGAASPSLDALGSGSLEAILSALSQIATGPNEPKTLQSTLLRQLMNAGA